MPSKDQQITDDLIARSIDIFRFSAGERAKIFEVLKRMEDDLTEVLYFSGKKLSDISRADKARLLRQAREAIEQYYGEASGISREALDGLARLESAATVASIGEAFQSAIVPSLPTEEVFRRLVDGTLVQGAPSSEWWRRQTLDTEFRFRLEVGQGIAQAETNDQIIRRIRGGVMDTARRNAAALVQTSVQTVANAARDATWQENNDVIKGLRQVSTLDGHTTPVCVAYSGGAWKLDGDRTPIAPTTLPFVNKPFGSASGTPRHWNCRSVMVPITKTFKELGLDIPEPPESTRASTDGQVRASETFDAFLKRKGDKFADDLLGPGRAELWRDGKITLQQLLDQSGRPLTLEQLRSKYDK